MATGRLKEVEEDAMRITAKRFRDNEEDLQYAQLKGQPQESHTPEEVLQEVQSQTSSTPAKSKVQLVSDEEVDEAKESADEAKPLSEVPDPKPSDKVEINTDSPNGKKGTKK